MQADKLRELLAKATPGPWQVIENKLPHYLGGEHTQRRIFTAWDHPQMKGPIPVAGSSIGIGPDKGGPALHFTHIDEGDAALIVAMRNAIEGLLAIAEEAEADRALLREARGWIGNTAGNAQEPSSLIARIDAALAGAVTQGQPEG